MKYLRLIGNINPANVLRKYDWAVILVIFCAFYIQFDLLEYIQRGPFSIHAWRQSDCLSMALNYYQFNLPLLEPQIHHLLGGEGKAVGEFPILYFFVGQLYHIFGPNVLVYRVVWLLITYFGILCLYRFLLQVSKNTFGSILGVIAIIGIPIYNFYSVSFISDAVSLSISFIAAYFVLRYIDSSRLLHLIFFFILFSLSALLKITSIVPFLAALGAACLFLVLDKGFRKNYFKKISYLFLAFTLSGLLVFGWYSYANYYQEMHNTTYFFLTTNSFWDTDPEIHREIWKNIKDKLYPFNIASILILSALAIFYLTVRKRFLVASIIFITLIGLGGCVFIWFGQYQYHDYYLVPFLGIVPLVVCFAWLFFQEAFIPSYKKFLIPFLGAISAFGIFHLGGKKMNERTNGYYAWDYTSRFEQVEGLSEYMRDLGFKATDKVISVPDPSPNISLYLLNVKGITNVYGKNKSEDTFRESLEYGVTHVVVLDSNYLNEFDFIKAYLGEKMGEKNGVSIYPIQGVN
ncbi:MAG: ArnT family glycosyltransferase [Luteibaculum sp.]